jgi:hypothetical protein
MPTSNRRIPAFAFSGELSELAAGLAAFEAEGLFCRDAGGILVKTYHGKTGSLRFDGTAAALCWDTRAHFFRLLGLLVEKLPGGAFSLEETAAFSSCGAMFDVSRNAVLSVEGFRFFLRRMALMGMDMAMLYTEDTYEVPGQPYFGYLRGRYTQEELRACDDYADQFGIELIPCIQTLAHLEKALRWDTYADLRDTSNILLAGDDRVYALLEQMLRAATAPFRSRRIHLGMDEAQGLGSGNYLGKNGYRPALEILRAHLGCVSALCEKLGLSPMIWSDMCLRPLSPTQDYYDFSVPAQEIPAEVASSVPTSIQLVYWDYYHESEAEYDAMFAKHLRFQNETVFAGGAWTWNGLVPDYGKAYQDTAAGLASARRAGVKQVFCTLWGDNGAETSYLCALPILQQFAECNYTGQPTRQQIEARFAACCGGCAEDFWTIRLLDETPGTAPGNFETCNPAKYLLYQDVLLGLFDRHAEGLPLGSWYAGLAKKMRDAGRRSPRYAVLFDFYAALAEVLARKALLGVQARAAYLAKDKSALADAAAQCRSLLPLVEELRTAWQRLWNTTRKSFGFEVIELRLGALCGRLQSAGRTLDDAAAGRIASIPELAVPRLYFDCRPENSVLPQATRCNLWNEIVSPNPVSMI